jgi:hypothetical protein
MTFPVNVLLGRTPSEQRQYLFGSRLFELSGSKGTVNGNKYYQEFKDMTATELCTFKRISNDIWGATSSGSLKA